MTINKALIGTKAGFQPEYVSISDAAILLGFSAKTIKRMIDAKMLHAIRIGSGRKNPEYRISVASIRELIKNNGG